MGWQTLAVDVSIWLTQFIKAMRDDEGKVVKNAHLLGTFRRIVKVRRGSLRRLSGIREIREAEVNACLAFCMPLSG